MELINKKQIYRVILHNGGEKVPVELLHSTDDWEIKPTFWGRKGKKYDENRYVINNGFKIPPFWDISYSLEELENIFIHRNGKFYEKPYIEIIYITGSKDKIPFNSINDMDAFVHRHFVSCGEFIDIN